MKRFVVEWIAPMIVATIIAAGLMWLGPKVLYPSERDCVTQHQLDIFYAELEHIHTSIKSTTNSMNIICVDIARSRGYSVEAAVAHCRP